MAGKTSPSPWHQFSTLAIQFRDGTLFPLFHTLIACLWSFISIEHGSSGSKTLLHLFQSHSDPGGKWSLMACKMGGRVSNFQSYLGLGIQLSYVVFLAYPDFLCREGVRKGFCGFWVAWCWQRAYCIFMELFVIVCRSPKQLAHILKLVMNLLHVQVDHEVCVHCRVIWLTFLSVEDLRPRCISSRAIPMISHYLPCLNRIVLLNLITSCEPTILNNFKPNFCNFLMPKQRSGTAAQPQAQL